MTIYTFNSKQYSIGDLEDMTRQELADLANLINETKLGPASTKAAGVERVLKALKGLGQKAILQETESEKAAPGVKKESKLEGHVPMAARARVIKRLTTHLLCRIKKVKAPPANERLKFWDKYPDGVTLAEIVQTNGLDETQVRFWVKKGYMTLVPPKAEELARQMDFFAKEGRLAD